MEKDTVVSLKKPAEESDPLSSLLREGARALLHDAVEAELATYLAEHGGERDAAGRRSIVWSRNHRGDHDCRYGDMHESRF